MKFNNNRVLGLFNNEGDVVGNTIRAISPDQKIVLSQGFGVSPAGIPLRFLAYVIPVLNLMKQLPKSAVAEFYFATEGVHRANPAYCRTVTARCAADMERLLRNYVQRRHPDHVSQVKILHDRPVVEARDEYTIGFLTDRATGLYKTDASLRNFVEKRGGYKALRYMVEHALYMRDPLEFTRGRSDWVLVEGMTLDMDHLIMVGGPAEKIFHRVRQYLCRVEGVHSQWVSHQFWTPIGSPPTYHPQEGEPVLLDPWKPLCRVLSQAASVGGQYRENVLRDLLILLVDASGWKEFRVGPLVRLLATGQKLDNETMAALEPGLALIRSL